MAKQRTKNRPTRVNGRLVLPAPEITENARTVLAKRYLHRDLQGRTVETPADLFERVAVAVAAGESRSRRQWADRFYELMASLKFLPNSPTLMNAGRPDGQLSACYVLPIEDSLDSIFETLKDAAKIHQSGGGTGFSFSRLRPSGSIVRSSQGVASGPVSFIRIFDVATETIKQGGARRGANMAVLRVDHPDIVEFIDSKRDHRSILNFNLSVGATDEFMKAVLRDDDFTLRNPVTQKPVKKVSAKELFDRIAQAAWECGDPGMIFLDRVNASNPTPQIGEIESTNPCGEQPLLPYESCNLGSLNVHAYWKGEGFDWDGFGKDIRTAMRFLDNVIDVNCFPVEETRKITLRNRKVGLGIMGFADLLLEMGIPYDSKDALDFGDQLMSFLNREAKVASAELAKEKGAFPNWKGSLWHKLGYPKLRNATVSTVAPTGTISIIAGASSGIEPIFAGLYYRNVLSGERLLEVHPVVQQLLLKRGKSFIEMREEELGEWLGAAWSPARQVSVEAHVRMQAVFQRHSDNAVSKTINLPREAKVSEIAHAYRLAYELGCKGITVYRDGSRPAQVLEPAGGKQAEAPVCVTC